MNKKRFLDYLSVARRDIGNLIFHFTKDTENADAFSALGQILSKGVINGGDGFIKGGFKCVCFTESPIAELNALFKLAELNADTQDHASRYQPYGIAVPKSWLFEQGGRPVIYQAEDEYINLGEAAKYRHVRYEPPAVDFTWEREWRVKTDALKLDPSKALVIVPTAAEAFELVNRFSRTDGVAYGDFDSETWTVPTWLVVSLDIFGFAVV